MTKSNQGLLNYFTSFPQLFLVKIAIKILTILHKFDLIRHNAIFLKSKLVKNVRNYVQYMSSIRKMCCARMQLQFSCIILNSKKKNMPGVSRGNMNNAPPIDIYLFKVNDENSSRMYEIFSKFKVKTLTSFWCIYF